MSSPMDGMIDVVQETAKRASCESMGGIQRGRNERLLRVPGDNAMSRVGRYLTLKSLQWAPEYESPTQSWQTAKALPERQARRRGTFLVGAALAVGLFLGASIYWRDEIRSIGQPAELAPIEVSPLDKL